MKNSITTIFFLLIIFLSSCDLINPLDDRLEGVNSGVKQKFDYTLTDADFTTIRKRALYLNPADTVNMAFLMKYKYFNDQVPAGTYVPMLLDQSFPMYQSGSQAKISYLYQGQMPDGLMAYANAPVYAFIAADYKSVNEDVNAAGYFSPIYDPANYLPKILKTRLDTATSGEFFAVTYKYSSIDPKIDYSAFAINPVWQSNLKATEELSELKMLSFAGNQNWKQVTSDDGAITIDGWDNGFNNNEDWLITPQIDLKNSSNTYMQLRHAVEYFDAGSLFILISTNFNGSDVKAATWKELPFPNYIGSNKNSYIESNVLDLKAYDGKKVHIAFKYVSDAAKAPYWGIGQIKIGPYGYKVTGVPSWLTTDYYQYNGTVWNKLDGVYSLSAPDYSGFGLSDLYFTGKEASLNYLPQFAASKFPYAKEGETIIFTYNYNNGSEIFNMADQLTYSAGSWKSAYNYIRTVSEPYASTKTGWVFDPTVNLTMTKADYAIIATFVKNDPVLSKLDKNTYVDSEYYYGASGYYGNFDTRNGKFYSAFGTWESAVTEAIGKVLLPAKYPDAETQYKGIDMHYIVHFVTYGAAASNYYMKFQCTKSAPNPEFTLVEGPIAE